MWTASPNTLCLSNRLRFSALKHSLYRGGNMQALNCSSGWCLLSQRHGGATTGNRLCLGGQDRLLRGDNRDSLLGRKPWGGPSSPREKDMQRHGSNSTISQPQLVQGPWSTQWKEWVEGLDQEGSESYWGFLSRDVPCTSLLSCVLGRTVGTGLEERERGAGWEITVVDQVKKNDEYRQIQEILRIKITRT